MIADITESILSICIPTFNRAHLLERTLESIVCQSEFAETCEVEIVISDNCSEDDTPAVGKRFAEAFPNKVKYHRNASNIVDLNYEAVLSKGSGNFLKLHNDYLPFRNGSLTDMLNVIKTTVVEKPMIFFSNGTSATANPIVVCNNLSEFVNLVSYYSTWIAGFGIWRDDFHAMTDFSRNAKHRLIQTDVLFRMIAAGKRAIVLSNSYFIVMDMGKKGGYSIAEVFGNNYLSLLKHYLHQGVLDKNVFESEKKAVLIHHIIPSTFGKGPGKGHDFVKENFFRHLEDYWREDYFHAEIEKLLFDKH